MMFDHLPSPEVLHWLAKGRLADRLLRSVRLWVLLHRLYGETDWAHRLPQPFRYANIRDHLFATTHSRSETAGIEVLSVDCDRTCICQRSLETWLAESALLCSVADWQQQVIKLTHVEPKLLSSLLKQSPFATVHRSIRDDLAQLADMGWLKREGPGRFCLVRSQEWPKLPGRSHTPLSNLSVSQTWEMLRALESIAFVQPNLEVIVRSLWDQLAVQPQNTYSEPEKRIFIHLDYILSEPMQEHVDTLQEQVEQLWRDGGGIIQFNYSLKTSEKLITVYPVCLHYARRAKYLSAYGPDPEGVLGWHNYRLDRIVSEQLEIVDWEDSQVPKPLHTRYKAGKLPTSAEVSDALEKAWGFNFYLPRHLLIMRFPPDFAQWYVHQSDRHATFQPIAYEKLPALIKRELADPKAKKTALDILSKRDSKDAYYQAWIRLGDINIVMRLRDWRPAGEVIAPLALRQQMHQESEVELSHYMAK
jgi:CRISPR-associated protein (TIGR03985 family)